MRLAQSGARHRDGFSTGKNIHATREWIIRNSPVPIGTVPDLSGAGKKSADARKE